MLLKSKKLLLSVKFSRVVQLTVFMVVFFSLSGFASELSQEVTLSVKNTPIKTVLKQLSRQTGLSIIYKESYFTDNDRVTIEVQNEPLEQVLRLCLAGKGCSWEIQDGMVVIRKAEKEDEDKGDDPSKYFEVTGLVTDEDGEPLVGVTVTFKGTYRGVITDSQGSFSIKATLEDKILVFSFLGMKKQEVPLSGRTAFHVKMKEDIAQIGEVTINGGYYTVKEKENTGSMTRITSKDIDIQTVSNPLEALQGKVPGLVIQPESGLPGAGVKVHIRGVNTLNGSATPLYVINGVPFNGDPITLGENKESIVNPAGDGESPLNFINAADIEDVTILKDADATALYGSRGANGVILITTKKGREGKTSVNVDARTGWSKIGKQISVLDTPEYLALRQQAFEANGDTPTASDDPDLLVWDQNTNNNFQKILLGNTARSNVVTTSISGGNERTNFLLSGTYDKRTTVLSDRFGSEKAAFNVNLGHTSTNDKFSTNMSIIYSSIENKLPSADYYGYVFTLPPNYPLYKEDGGINYTSADYNIVNPLTYAYTSYISSTNSMIGSWSLQYEILPRLFLKSNIGYSRIDNQTNQKVYSRSIDPQRRYSQMYPHTQFSENISESVLIEPQLNYSLTFGKSSLNFLLGGNWQQNKSETPVVIYADQYDSDVLLDNFAAAGTYRVSSTGSEYRYQSTFGQIRYIFDSRYIVNLNFRRDGSSLFGENNRYGNFGAVGAAWLFSEEELFKNLSWLSYGKLRGSYGVVGNDNAAAYAYISLYGVSDYGYGYGTDNLTGLIPSRLVNQDYQWERTKKLEFALESAFFKDRLSTSVAWFRNRSDNQLVAYPVSGQTGFNYYQRNLPATIQNTGFEFTLHSANVRTKDFSWSTDLNISTTRNKLLKYDGIEESPYVNKYIVGESVSTIYGFAYDGIDPDTKLPAVKDLNGDGYYSTNLYANNQPGDFVKIGNSLPDFIGGFSNTLRYKNLQLDFYFTFSQGVKMKGVAGGSDYLGGMSNFSKEAIKKFKGLYDNEEDFNNLLITSLWSNYGAYVAFINYQSSNAVMEDASYIRLQNVSLSYRLPTWLIHKAGGQSGKFFVQGQNLFTITNYSGADPQTGSFTTPPVRMIILGAKLSF